VTYESPYDVVVRADCELEMSILSHIRMVNESDLCPTVKSMESDFGVHYDLIKHYIRRLQKIEAIRLLPLFGDDGLLAGRGYQITDSGKQ